MNTFTEQYTPYQLPFISNKEERGLLDSDSPWYFTNFFGRNERNDQKEVVINLFF